jgi:MoaA/NifB/PqqE/SkfB family radical SAM enzyme
MKEIYRTYEDTEVHSLVTNIQCPYCDREWQEEDMDECGTTYLLTCGDEDEDNENGCGKQFEIYFDAS